MKRLAALAGLVVLGSTVVVGDACADSIGPPPSRCPEGSAPFQCHGPDNTCEASACTSDASCGAGRVCRERSLCTRAHCCRGGWSGCQAPGDLTTHVAGPCGAGGARAEADTTCTALRVCVPDGTRANAEPAEPSATPVAQAPNAAGTGRPSGGGCTVAGAGRASGLGFAVIILFASMAWLRRGRRSP